MRRTAAVTLLLAGAVLALFLTQLRLGDYPVTLAQVLTALAGGGGDDLRMVVTEWRLPRAGLAPVIGALLGLSGAIFQSLLRNPLGSPDIIGFDAGAQAGAVAVLLASGGFAALASGALAGGLAVAAAVYLLAWQAGLSGLRLILIGIGIGQLLFALSQWLLLRVEPETAVMVAVWGAGSLNGLGADRLVAALTGAAVLIPFAAILAPFLRQLELGEDAARATGLNVEAARRALIFCGVALTAVATAVVGPVSFVALIAPQLGAALTGRGACPLPIAALSGAALLAAADLAAAHAFGALQLPVGVVTLSLGGLWFLALLAQGSKGGAHAAR